MKTLQILLNAETPEELIIQTENILQVRDEADRIVMLVKARYRLPKKCSLAEVEMHLMQKLNVLHKNVVSSGLLPTYFTGNDNMRKL